MNSSYTYYLIHIPTGKKYYGYRYANIVDPEKDLWNEYFSSSKQVKLLIEQYGKESFQYEIRKIFETKEEAFKWEQTVLRRMKAIERDDWLNQVNYPEEFCFDSNGKNNGMYGKKHTEKWKENRSIAMTGEKHHMYGKIRQDFSKRMSGKGNPMYGKHPTDKSKNKNSLAHRAQGYPLLLGVDEKIYKIEISLIEFCKKYNLNHGHMSDVINGKRQSHKGWKLAII